MNRGIEVRFKVSMSLLKTSIIIDAGLEFSYRRLDMMPGLACLIDLGFWFIYVGRTV